jgi:hypothetical protein
MEINFFEEFSTDKNLEKAKLINFKSTLFIAANSLENFNKLKKKIKNKQLEVAYWPILKKSYWISPFSYNLELEELYKNLSNNKNKLKVLIDLELPILNKKLFFINLISFKKNKKIIESIFENSQKFNIEIYTAENPVTSEFLHFLQRILGTSYSLEKYKHNKIIMYYSSMIPMRLKKFFSKFLIERRKTNKDSFIVGLGTITKGIKGNEPILTPKELDKDLDFFNKNDFKEAFIFRLGGLNKEYIKIIEKYLN